MPVDQHVQRMIEELKGALAQTLRSSASFNEAARKIRREGLDLHLILSFGGAGEAQPEGPAKRTATRPAEPAEEPAPRADAEPAKRTPPSVREPQFRLSGQDVTLLESLGIDPTRRVRSSSRRRRPPLA